MTSPPMPPGMPVDTPFNAANMLLAEMPARMVTSIIQTPKGSRMSLTIRTPTGELTVFLAKQDVKIWAMQLLKAEGGMSESGLTVVNGALPQAGPAMPLPRPGQQ